MTEFVLDGFSCRAEGSGDVLVMLFSGFDEQLFREVCGLVPDCRCVLAEFGEIDWDRDYSPWEASSGGRRFSGGAERLLAFLPEAPDEAKFRKIADELGIDQNEYIAALKKVKIVPKRQIEAAANLLWQMANSLSEVGYERLVAIESQKNKENTVKAVDQKFGEIDSRMGDVVANIQDLENVFGAIKESAASSTKAVESTDGIVKAIENASTQLTLIGFNASIEAKRAGAAGAGFNVIAQEVRTLADKNTKQANEVENTLNEIKKAITGINAQLKNCNSEIQKNVEVLESLKVLVDEASVEVKNLK